MEEMHELAADLKSWVNHHNIVERSVESFFERIEHRQKEYPEYMAQHFPDALREDFTVIVSDVWIMLSWPEHSGGDYFVVTHIPVIYKGEKRGRYSTIFLISGEWEDDVWDTEDPL